MAVVLTGLVSEPAIAHQNPPGCGFNGLALQVGRDKSMVTNGDHIKYEVRLANNTAGACDVTGATVELILPAADGTATGQHIVMAAGAGYPAAMGEITLGTYDYTVALNPGVTRATVRATVSGVLHSLGDDRDTAFVDKILGTDAPPPTISLTKVATPTSGFAPLAVTYTYTVVNTSPIEIPIKEVIVSDDLCNPVGFIGGDANGDKFLNLGEVWSFSCTTTHTSPGTYIDTAVASGKHAIDNRPVVSPPATQTVVVSAPPIRVASGNCVSVPKKLSVRARELTTVRVTVTGSNVKGASVKLTGAGIKRSGKTNSKGVATFKVRPTKKGTLVVKSDRCLDAARVSVKAARQTQSRQVPKNTG